MPIKVYNSDKSTKSISFKIGNADSYHFADKIYGVQTYPNPFGSVVGDNVWHQSSTIDNTFHTITISLIAKKPLNEADIKIQISSKSNVVWLDRDGVNIGVTFSIMPDYEFYLDFFKYGSGGWYQRIFKLDDPERAKIEQLAQLFIDNDGSENIVDLYISPNQLIDIKNVIDVSAVSQKELDSVFVKDIEVFRKPDFIFIPEPHSYVTDNYGYFKGGTGSVTPSADNWKPKGDIEYIDARYTDSNDVYWFHLKRTGYGKWENWDVINLSAKSSSGDEITLTDLHYGSQLYSVGFPPGAQTETWFNFIKNNVGNEISVWIEEVI